MVRDGTIRPGLGGTYFRWKYSLVGSSRPGPYITEFCERLVEVARQRVRSGAVSERGLARMASISQPHLHNVLKGIRVLSTEAADRLMEALGVTIAQVLWSDEATDLAEIRVVPVLRQRIGPGTVASFTAFRDYMPFPASLVAGLTDPLSAWLGPDLALPGAYRAGDLLLLDLNPRYRTNPGIASCWIVAESSGLRVRYVRRDRGMLEAATEPDAAGARGWQPVAVRGRNILDIVRARIVWIGRRMESSPEGSAGPFG